MCDGDGLSQFMNTWAEMARGATKPSIAPVWRRELLMTRDPPRITCNHREYMQIPHNMTPTTFIPYENHMVLRSFFFGPSRVAAIRGLVPPHLQHCSTFDLITACFWRCRTKALQIEAEEEVRMMVIVNARAKFNPPLPVGYYGNAFAYPAAVTTAGKLRENPFGYAVNLINKVKGEVTEEYMHSVADLMVNKGQYIPVTERSFMVSDLRYFGSRETDFGWGDAAYGGVAKGGLGPFPAVTFVVPFKNAKGEEGVVLPIWLPPEAMNRFTKELGTCVL